MENGKVEDLLLRAEVKDFFFFFSRKGRCHGNSIAAVTVHLRYEFIYLFIYFDWHYAFRHAVRHKLAADATQPAVDALS